MSHDRSISSSVNGSQMVFQLGSPLVKRPRAIESRLPGSTRPYHTRKPHAKSRQGCAACKAVRVKCDEGKPCCRRCGEKNISCQYPNLKSQLVSKTREMASRKAAIIQHSIECQSVPPLLWPGHNRPIVLTLSDPDRQSYNGNDLLLLHYYQSATSHDIGFPEWGGINEDFTLELALEHSYLMHAVLAVGATHLRRLKPEDRDIRSAEMMHWQSALSSFRAALNFAPTRDNCDAILLSSILLNLMAFACIPRADLSPSKSWVFSDSPQQLGWLYIQLGLRHLLEQTKPFRMDTRLTPIFDASDDSQGTFSDESPGIQGLPPAFVKVCGLDASSAPGNNPYHSPLRLLTPLLTLKRCGGNLFKFLHWFACVDDKFASLLQVKDHPALLLLSYWLGMLCELDQWWCRERAKRECTAICMLLKHRGNTDIVRLLNYPARACGYPL